MTVATYRFKLTGPLLRKGAAALGARELGGLQVIRLGALFERDLSVFE